MPQHKLLFIDAYDSFSTNIVALLAECTAATIHVVHHDDARLLKSNEQEFASLLTGFDAVVAGPGPGNPADPSDIAAVARLWTLPRALQVPVLGICLGFQSLALSGCAHVYRLSHPRHGLVAAVDHCKSDLFPGSGQALVMQYNSLAVSLRHGPRADLWSPSEACPDLVPLAWSLADVPNGPILMAVKHRSKPFWGVQYHPESILTDKSGADIVRKWWDAAKAWNSSSRQYISSTSPSLPFAISTGSKSTYPLTIESYCSKHVQSAQLALHQLTVSQVVSTMSLGAGEPLVLQSGTTADGDPVNAETGRFSIIGLPNSPGFRIFKYHLNTRTVSQLDVKGAVIESAPVEDIWTYLEHVVEQNRASGGTQQVPFWGGLIGFVSYEACLPCTGVAPSKTMDDRPDLAFALVERSVVVDHVEKTVHIQSIVDNDNIWIQKTAVRLARSAATTPRAEPKQTRPAATHHIDSPTQGTYIQKVDECKSQIRYGNSYELCLTAPTLITFPQKPSRPSSKILYSALTTHNPAPFSANLTLNLHSHTATILSSSPERFLSWTRHEKCQFRPIKGTVRKSPDVTRASAAEALSSPKERAENVMIVDLVRHDLRRAAGLAANAVRVPRLCSVEEYATVFQSVSVVEGDASGVGVLRAALPPGSMTGAPKRRSCEILQALEGRPRGVYSGVLGYLDFGGGGDFSVVIRTAVRWRRSHAADFEGVCERPGEDGDADADVWEVGAGGAITTLSEPEMEWEEMLTKREAILKVLCGAGC